MKQCLFCRITSKEIATHQVYEDDFALAFMDKNPINNGHLLVVSKQHRADFYNLDERFYMPLMMAVKKMARLVKKVIKPKKVGLIVAGWDVSHAHVHVVPMWEYHDITSKSMLEGGRPAPSDDELAATAKLLIRALNTP